jgi:RimJ/RimL family protein N-acetyltransferase
MLRGGKVILRARHEDDVPVLHAELYEDVMTRSRADSRPWRPLAMSQGSPYAVAEPSDGAAVFSVERLSDGELAGEALLWSIDVHNRVAHIGISLRPAARGCGLGTDVVAVLCRYAFAILGLHRLQIETLVDNMAMQRAAMHSGFVVEGMLRQSAWVDSEFVDEVVLGLLATDLRSDQPSS